MDSDANTVNVVYASQTGTAQDYAARTARELWTHGYAVALLDIGQVPLGALVQRRSPWILVVSTCGQGDLPSSAGALWRELLDAGLPGGLLADGQRFAVLGLGDSSYEHFNYAAKKVYRRLEQLGASFLLPPVFADEQAPGGLDDGFDAWTRSLVSSVAGLGIEREEGRPMQDMYRMQEMCRVQDTYRMQEMCRMETHDTTLPPLNGTVSMNQRLTPGACEKDVRLVRITFKGPPVRHGPGDVAVLHPQSQDCDIVALCQRLHWDPSATYTCTPQRPDALLPRLSCSLFELLKHYLDIYSYPKRSFFAILSSKAGNPDEAGKLHDIATDDHDLYLEYCVRPRRSPLEILNDFVSVQGVPVALVFELLPLTRPRSFSIASCTEQYIELAVALVRYKTKWIVGEREGLASRFLSRVQVGHRVRVEIVPGDISGGAASLASFAQVVLIGAGTGIAPLRSIVQQLGTQDPDKPVHLFYGCRYLHQDCLFADEFRHTLGVTYHALGSRDGHVRQHIDVLLKDHRELLRRLLVDTRSVVFLSGNNHLPKLVKGTIDEIVGVAGFADFLHKHRRFHYECWG